MEYLFLIAKNIASKKDHINPIDPAVKPTTKKNANSDKSLGIEFTIRLN